MKESRMSEFKLKRRQSAIGYPEKKRFHASDDLLFQFDFVKYTIEQEPTFTREYIQLHASPDVTWRDVANEIHKLYI